MGAQGVAEPQDVGMLHGASDNKALIVSGCTSVHPYKYDDSLSSATSPFQGRRCDYFVNNGDGKDVFMIKPV